VSVLQSVKTYETNKKGKFSVRVRDTTDVITFEKEGYYSETMTVSNAKQVKVGLTKKKTQKSGETITDRPGSRWCHHHYYQDREVGLYTL